MAKIICTLLITLLMFSVSCSDIDLLEKGGKYSSSSNEIVNGSIPDPDQMDAVTLSTVPLSSEIALNEERSNCTATIIKPTIIISAAHCFRKIKDYTVTFSRNLKKDRSRSLKIIKFITHDEFFVTPGGYDIALGLLEDEVPFPYRPAPLYNGSYKVDETEVTVSGYGITHKEAPKEDTGILRQAKLKFFKYKGHDQITLKGYTGEDTCRGDSGGPAYVKSEGIYYLAGITSWGKCEGIGQYTDVRKYFDWIEENIAELFSDQTLINRDLSDTAL